jgi:hypothetical protein
MPLRVVIGLTFHGNLETLAVFKMPGEILRYDPPAKAFIWHSKVLSPILT